VIPDATIEETYTSPLNSKEESISGSGEKIINKRKHPIKVIERKTIG